MIDPTWTVQVKRADTDLVKCPKFLNVAWTDYRLFRVSLRLEVQYLLIGDTGLPGLEVQRTLVGAVTRNKW